MVPDMPRVVEHEERRREVVRVATDLVVKRGRGALTVRNVAEGMGCSTMVVSHYFADMRDLLHATYTAAANRARERLDGVVAADPLDLQAFMEALLPLDAERRADWAIWFAFWTEALTDARLRADQRGRARTTTARIAAVLRARIAAGVAPSHIDVDAIALRLGALIPGIAAQAAFDPRGWTAQRQRSVVCDELRTALCSHR